MMVSFRCFIVGEGETNLLDIVIGKGATVLQLFTSKDQTLLIWWDPFLVLDFGLHIVNCIGGLDLQSDGFPGKGLDENLHTTTQTKDQVESRLLLDIVIRESAAIFQLLTSEDQTLLIWRNTLLILNLGLDVVDGIGGLHLQGDGLASQCLYEDLHTTTKTEDEVESRLLLNVVVREGSA